MRVGLVQLSVSDNPATNLAITLAAIREAVGGGAKFVATPEVTNFISTDRDHQTRVAQIEAEDMTLAALRAEARSLGVWLLIGSLALKRQDDTRLANRSFLINPEGEIVARYDKIHMFDVQVSDTETYRESAGYKPGERAVLGKVGDVPIGLTICYDLRFPHLYRCLAEAGAEIIAVPSAFSPVTGAAHWEPLLRARAIETGAFVIAPAQCGRHTCSAGRSRATHGHAMIVSPWGEVLADLGEQPGVNVVTLDLDAVADARRRVPSLSHFRPFEGP